MNEAIHRRLSVGVQGMTCASCAARVERALKIDGVQDVSVNLATEKASVTFDPQKVGVPALLGAVKARGYTPVTAQASLGVTGHDLRLVCGPRRAGARKNGRRIRRGGQLGD